MGIPVGFSLEIITKQHQNRAFLSLFLPCCSVCSSLSVTPSSAPLALCALTLIIPRAAQDPLQNVESLPAVATQWGFLFLCWLFPLEKFLSSQPLSQGQEKSGVCQSKKYASLQNIKEIFGSSLFQKHGLLQHSHRITGFPHLMLQAPAPHSQPSCFPLCLNLLFNLLFIFMFRAPPPFPFGKTGKTWGPFSLYMYFSLAERKKISKRLLKVLKSLKVQLNLI